MVHVEAVESLYDSLRHLELWYCEASFWQYYCTMEHWTHANTKSLWRTDKKKNISSVSKPNWYSNRYWQHQPLLTFYFMYRLLVTIITSVVITDNLITIGVTNGRLAATTWSPVTRTSWLPCCKDQLYCRAELQHGYHYLSLLGPAVECLGYISSIAILFKYSSSLTRDKCTQLITNVNNNGWLVLQDSLYWQMNKRKENILSKDQNLC